MTISQRKSKRTPSGKRYKFFSAKKDYETGRRPSLTGIGEVKRRILRVLGGNLKPRLLQSDEISLYDPKSKKHVKAKIKNVVDNPANINYIRRNTMTKGAIVDTDKGKARITSRPGQDGTINGVLVTD